MLPDCAAILTELGPGQPTERVFRRVPRIRTLNADLKEAGLTRCDHTGRTLDFHAVRYSIATKKA